MRLVVVNGKVKYALVGKVSGKVYSEGSFEVVGEMVLEFEERVKTESGEEEVRLVIDERYSSAEVIKVE